MRIDQIKIIAIVIDSQVIKPFLFMLIFCVLSVNAYCLHTVKRPKTSFQVRQRYRTSAGKIFYTSQYSYKCDLVQPIVE